MINMKIKPIAFYTVSLVYFSACAKRREECVGGNNKIGMIDLCVILYTAARFGSMANRVRKGCHPWGL